MSPVTQGRLFQYQSEIAILYRLIDVSIIACGFAFALFLYQTPWSLAYMAAVSLAFVFFLFSAELVGVYRPWRGAPMRQMVGRLWVAWVLVVVLLLAAAYISKTTGIYSRVAVTGWLLATPLLLVAWRALLGRLLTMIRKKGLNTRRAAIVGAGDLARRVADVIHSHPDYGIHMLGFYGDEGDFADEEMVNSVEIAGNIDDLLQDAGGAQPDLVYIAIPLRKEERIRQLLKRFSNTTASVYLVPDFFMYDMLRGYWWVNLGDVPTLGVYETPFYGIHGWIKRLEDIVLASVILVLMMIPMLLIGLAVRLTSKGPAIFKQDRYGLDGTKIPVWKFRTMKNMDNGADIPQATKNDPRVTPLGKILRKFSLDELPQFINVLQGGMSIVGPRPHAIAHNEQYRQLIEGYMLRHKIKPGITGWAQINGWRGETETLNKMERRIEHDLWYIRNWSLLLDFRIIAITAWQFIMMPSGY